MQFEIAHSLILKSKQVDKDSPYYMSNTDCFEIAGVSKSGYYAWLNRRKQQAKRKEREKYNDEFIAAIFESIIHKFGYVPGKKVFSITLWREFHLKISERRCSKIMKQNHMYASRPKKDPYKHQATHDHVCSVGKNYINQNFYVAPRKIILTDITYLHYGQNREPFYLCAFKDAYTKEILGHSTGSRMTVGLVKEAYDLMMKNHGNEFKQPDVYIHSDQGSQYMSTTFKQLLENDNFIQSVSERGNSQDNAPMESFFGTMKTRIMDKVAMCPTLKLAQQMVTGYIDKYNNEFYQHNLAALTPSEFYKYLISGVYPCPEYFGVKASDLNTIDQLVQKRLEYAKRKQERLKRDKYKSTDEKNRLKNTPIEVSEKDLKLVQKLIKQAKEAISDGKKQLEKFKDLKKSIEAAIKFLADLKENNPSEYDALSIPQEWHNHSELSYIFSMKELF